MGLSTLMCAATYAAPLTVCDFEDYPIGTEWIMWNTNASTAKVEADPLNANNKVLEFRRVLFRSAGLLLRRR